MDFKGKHGLVVGVANKRSLAWAIAQSTASRGATLALTYQGRFEENVRELAAELPSPSIVLPCDVTSDADMDALESALDALPAPLEPLDLSMLDGFLAGVLLQPTPVPEAEWLRHVYDADGAVFARVDDRVGLDVLAHPDAEIQGGQFAFGGRAPGRDPPGLHAPGEDLGGRRRARGAREAAHAGTLDVPRRRPSLNANSNQGETRR